MRQPKLFDCLLFLTLSCVLLLATTIAVATTNQPTVQTVVVTAEGLADPNALVYQKDKGLMIDDLRRDAQRQAVEKAVGVYVESSTLVENYLLIEDQVLSKSSGLIKQILDESSPKLGEDGLMHLRITAEVFLGEVKQALDSLSKERRLSLIRQAGNPTISVAIVVKDADRNSETAPENSPVAENLLKEHFVNFGYRVWSEEYSKLLRREAGSKSGSRRVADFSVLGEAKFRKATVTLKASGITLTKHALTSWTVKCINNHTGEEIYFNNQVPKKQSWPDEDQALEDVGRLIGEEFTKDFFELHMMQPTSRYQVQIAGLPDYDTALLFADEFVGLRNIVGVELINFESEGLSLFEIECTGGDRDLARLVNNTILKPLNAKLAGPRLKLSAAHGNVIEVKLDGATDADQVVTSLTAKPPAALLTAAPERIASLVTSPEILQQLLGMSPELASALEKLATQKPKP